MISRRSFLTHMGIGIGVATAAPKLLLNVEPETLIEAPTRRFWQVPANAPTVFKGPVGADLNKLAIYEEMYALISRGGSWRDMDRLRRFYRCVDNQDFYAWCDNKTHEKVRRMIERANLTGVASEEITFNTPSKEPWFHWPIDGHKPTIGESIRFIQEATAAGIITGFQRDHD